MSPRERLRDIGQLLAPLAAFAAVLYVGTQLLEWIFAR